MRTLALLMLAASQTPLVSQTFYGSIVGTVSDASGAVMPGAAVALTNLGTSDRKQVSTDAAGNYVFLNLAPGRYRVEVEQAGFKRFKRDEVQVEVQAAVRIDAAMQVGDVGQVVEVTGQTPLLQTESASLGQVVDSRKVLEMPLNGRNIFNLVALVPGVVPQGGSPTFVAGNFQIGGGMANQQAAFLDGAPLNTGYYNGIAFSMTQDAVQEFRVETNNAGADVGKFAGGVISLSSKSGTNEFHGSAYDFLRNKVLNANGFFANRAGLTRPAFTQNQFGATLGGPIKRDKAFFFFSYEGFRQRQGRTFTLTVPTEAMKAGDFSDLRASNGNLVPIYDALTTCGRLGNAPCATNAAGAEVISRSPFPNNVIPTSRLDPTARILTGTIWGGVRPNLPGERFTTINNFSRNVSTGQDASQYTGKVDHIFSEKQRIFGRFTYQNSYAIPAAPFQNNIYVGNRPGNNAQAVFGDTYTFSPSLIADIRASYTRNASTRSSPFLNTDLTKYGWPSSYNNQVSFRTFPSPCIPPYDGGQGGGVFAESLRLCSADVAGMILNRGNIYTLSGNVTKIWGRHNVKFGAEHRTIQFNFAQVNNPSGGFTFNNVFTSASPFASAGTGYGFASFMLGYGASGTLPQAVQTASQIRYQGYHVADNWVVTNRLTLSLGLRWEYPGSWTERFDRIAVLLPGAGNELAKPTGLPLLGRLGLVNTPDRPARQQLDVPRNLIAPRLGLAYRISNKDVIRAGYGIFFLPSDASFALPPRSSAVNNLSTDWVTSLDGGLTPASTLNNPFPNGILPAPQRDPALQRLLLGQSVNVPISRRPYSYMQQWNFTLAREFGQGTMIEAGYAGSRGVHILGVNTQLNQLSEQNMALGTRLQQQVPNPFFGLIGNGILSNRTVAYGQLLRPYPQFNSVTNPGPSDRDSIYHSLQVKGEKRFRSRGSLLLAYTWAKLLSNTESLTSWLESNPGAYAVQNNYRLDLDRSSSGYDVPHRLVVSYVLDLPFGKGQRWASGFNGFLDKVVSGWGLNGIATFQSGFRLGLITNANQTNSFGGASRPNNNGQSAAINEGRQQDRLQKWFKTENFSQPAAFTFGNAARVLPDVYASGINNWDIALVKNTMVTERVKVSFRAEIFNPVNRVQFNYPGMSLGVGDFGVVGSQANFPRLVQLGLRASF